MRLPEGVSFKFLNRGDGLVLGRLCVGPVPLVGLFFLTWQTMIRTVRYCL